MNESEFFEEIKAQIPAAQRQAEHRAAFLAEVQRVSSSPVIRPSLWSAFPKPSINEAKGKPKTMKRYLLLVAILILAASAVFAQNILSFFQAESSDSQTVTLYYAPHHEETLPNNAAQNLSLEEAVALAPYEALVPQVLPTSYGYTSAHYDAMGTRFRIAYTCKSPWTLEFLQRPVAESELDLYASMNVGASAVIEDVLIHTAHGQYTRGIWKPNRDTPLSDAEPMVEVTSTWLNEVNFHYLTWYQDGMLFNISTTGGILNNDTLAASGCELSLDDLVAMAESLSPLN